MQNYCNNQLLCSKYEYACFGEFLSLIIRVKKKKKLGYLSYIWIFKCAAFIFKSRFSLLSIKFQFDMELLNSRKVF